MKKFHFLVLILLVGSGVFAQVPSCVSYTYPANNSIINANAPTLIWQDLGGAGITYIIYLGTNNNPPQYAITYNNKYFYSIPSNNPLLPNTTYYWYVVPVVNSIPATGCISNIRSFTTSNITTPSCVTNISPSNNSTTISVKPTLTWSGNPLASRYDIYIGTNNNPTTLLASNVFDINGYFYAIPSTDALLPNTTYYWYVVPRDGANVAVGCISNVTSFTTASLSCVSNTSPSNNSTSISVRPTFTWQAALGAASYDIYLGSSNNNTALLASNITLNSYTYPNNSSALLPNTTYYWYVVPKNGTFNAAGCVNNITSFTTSPLTCVTNFSPPNNSTNNALNPTLYFNWSSPEAATNYDIYLDTNPNPSTLIGNKLHPCCGAYITYTLTSNFLLQNTTYYWYVVPKNGAYAATGCQSNTTAFTTGTLSCVPNISPANNSTGISRTPTLQWQSNAVATSYDLYFGTNNNSITLLTNVSNNNYTLPLGLLSFNTTYYWYVVPKNGAIAATGCANNVTSFTTRLLSCVGNTTPANNATGINLRPTLIWQSNADATSYDLYIGTTNNPTTLVANVTTNNYTIPLANALAPNTTYYWYVVPKNGAIAATGCASNITSFTTLPIACVTNISPLNNATNISVQPYLSWQSSAVATSYDVYLGTNNTPTNLIANVATNSYTVPAVNSLLSNTIYYWYVVPKNGNTSTSGCISNVTSFTTGALVCGVNNSPINNATNVSLSPSLYWATSPIATNYDIYLGNTNPPTTLLANTSNNGFYNLVGSTNHLLENNTYYWYVVPKNGPAAAVGCANNVTSFNTVSSICIPSYTYNCAVVNAAIIEFNLFGEQGTTISTTPATCASAPYYTNLTASSNTNLALGKAYVGNIKLNGPAIFSSIWIDFNNNNGFEMAECVLNNLGGLYDLAVPYSIYIPSNATLGVHKMRVRTGFGDVNSSMFMQPCALYQYGETKDFTVTIVPTGTPYTVSTKTNCENLAFTSINAITNNNNVAVPILDNIGNIAATINANGSNLGIVNSSIYRNTGAVRQVGSGSYYLDRNITITPTIQPNSGNVSVRLFYTASELAAFQAVVPTANTSSLNISKTNQGCAPAFGGTEVLLPQTGNGTFGSDYYVDVSTSGFSSFYIKNGLGALPISIIYFKGIKQQNINLLDWKLNCDAGSSISATLERSEDGVIFNDLQTQTITDVMCANPFTYKDAKPLAGANYYRLKIVTANGEIKYSTIVVLLNKDKGFELISIAPNPLQNNAILTITSARAEKINVTVSDVTGKRIMTQATLVIAGNNTINMNFEAIAAGTYFITALNADGEIKTIRFVKY
jgi:hypothetical protein